MLSTPARRITTAAATGGLALAAYQYQQQHLAHTAAKSQTIVLTYFDSPGRALLTRAALKHAGVDFVDERLNGKQFTERKGPGGFNDKVPLGQLPTLQIGDGVVHVQSSAIGRWAAKKAGWYPSNADDALVVDEIIECVDEMNSKVPMDPKNPDEQTKKRLEWLSTTVNRTMLHIERLIQAKQGSSGPYVLGKQVSMADFRLYTLVTRVREGSFDGVPKDCLDRYKLACGVAEAMQKHPAIIEQVGAKKN